MRESLVSILIPAYNHEKYIASCLQSALKQSYCLKNIELIIINDGSTDNTHIEILKMLPACEASFQYVEYINKANEGVQTTLNLAISKAKGVFLYILPSDDSAEPEAIETLHDFLSQHDDYALAVGDNFIMDESGRRCRWDKNQCNVFDKRASSFASFGAFLKHNNPKINFNSEEFGTYQSLLVRNYIPNGFLIRTEIIKRLGGYDDKPVLEDYNLLLKLSKHYKLKYIDQPLFNYRWHDHNTAKNKPLMMRLALNTLLNEREYCKQNVELNVALLDAIDYWKPKIIPYKYVRSLYKAYLKISKPLRRLAV